MSYKQYELRDGDSRMTCWLKEAPAVKAGSLITLKHEPDRWWEVVAVHGPKQHEPPERFWKVGGIL